MDRVNEALNRRFETKEGIKLFKGKENSLSTSEEYCYRSTGINQIEDIINTGYIRSGYRKSKPDHKFDVDWSHGSDTLFYSADYPILVVKDSIFNGGVEREGAFTINDLAAIYKKNSEGIYTDILGETIKKYEERQLTPLSINDIYGLIQSYATIANGRDNNYSMADYYGTFLVENIKTEQEAIDILNRASADLASSNNMAFASVLKTINEDVKLRAELLKQNATTNDYDGGVTGFGM